MKNETARREIESLDYYLQNHTNDYSEESHTAMMMAMDALSNSEKPNKWIPCSERLPEFIFNNTVSEDVLVFDGVDIRVGEYRKGKYLNGAGYWRVYGYDLEEYVDVTAWMPLPKPYEPQEISDRNLKMWEEIFKAESEDRE